MASSNEEKMQAHETRKEISAASAPLSQFLQTERDVTWQEDGWTILSSEEAASEVSARPSNLSALKQLKRFLADVPRQDTNASFLSETPETTPETTGYHVDYPYYDADREPLEPSSSSSALIENEAPVVEVVIDESKEEGSTAKNVESDRYVYSYNEQLTISNDLVEYSANPDTQNAPNAELDPSNNIDKPEAPEINDEETENKEPVEVVVEELPHPQDKTVDEAVKEEEQEKPAEEEFNVEETEAPEVVAEDQTATVIKSTEENATYVVDLGDLASEAFERLDQGVETPELPQIVASKPKRAKRNVPKPQVDAKSLQHEPIQIEPASVTSGDEIVVGVNADSNTQAAELDVVVETSERSNEDESELLETLAEPTPVRHNRDAQSRLTIFQRFIKLVAKHAENEGRPRTEEVEYSHAAEVVSYECPRNEVENSTEQNWGDSVVLAIAPYYSPENDALGYVDSTIVSLR